MRHPLASGHVPSAWWHSGANRAGTARSAVGQECGEPFVLAMKAPGTVIKISSAWVMHTHAEWPAGSALDLSPLRA